MISKVNIMLDLQDSINRHVHPEWTAQGFAWYRAIWTECAEMMEHYGWKWWKKQSPDADQVSLELVDIWHFGLSILLVEKRPADHIDSQLQDGLAEKPAAEFREALEAFTLDVLQTRSFDLTRFAHLMTLVGLSFDELYCRYVGKNMLNRFRQDNGYKDGSYKKVWNGLEDNEVLMNVLQSTDTEADDFADQVYALLAKHYPG
jgi:dimeric dUTPase (all-alpha-NTP-PPase superfamily)